MTAKRLKTFKFFWTTHKWTGIILAAVFVMMSATGFLLLIKKDYEWIQPPTMRGGEGTDPAAVITFQEMYAAMIAAGHPDFTSLDDVDRIDYRPQEAVFKIHSHHNYSEIQISAETGDVLGAATRTSDLIESIHDGSFIAGWFHDWVMPLVAIALSFLAFSGIWLWIEPIVRKRRRKRRDAMWMAGISAGLRPRRRAPPPQRR